MLTSFFVVRLIVRFGFCKDDQHTCCCRGKKPRRMSCRSSVARAFVRSSEFSLLISSHLGKKSQFATFFFRRRPLRFKKTKNQIFAVGIRISRIYGGCPRTTGFEGYLTQRLWICMRPRIFGGAPTARTHFQAKVTSLLYFVTLSIVIRPMQSRNGQSEWSCITSTYVIMYKISRIVLTSRRYRRCRRHLRCHRRRPPPPHRHHQTRLWAAPGPEGGSTPTCRSLASPQTRAS